MGMRERDIEEMADQFVAGHELLATGKIASDRYSAGSTAVAVAIELFKRHGIEMVEQFQKSLEYSEETA
jgi:glutathione S-transferase